MGIWQRNLITCFGLNLRLEKVEEEEIAQECSKLERVRLQPIGQGNGPSQLSKAMDKVSEPRQ